MASKSLKQIQRYARTTDPKTGKRTFRLDARGEKVPTGKVWEARYRDPAGRQIKKYFPRKVDAQKWLDHATTGIVTGQYVDPNAGKITFREYAEEWRERRNHKPSSAAHYETMLRRHAYPTLGDLPLSSITVDHVETWVKSISATLAPSTVQVLHGIVSSCLKSAVRSRRIPSNPCEGTALPPAVPHQLVLPTDEQVATLYETIAPDYRALVHLCAATGLRQGEAFGLTVDRVDFLRGIVTVDRQAVALAKQPLHFGTPKRPKSYRSIPIPRDVVEALSAHIARFGAGDHGLIFHADDGGFVRRSTFSAQVWKPAREAAGMSSGTGLHALRHYYASRLIRFGESIKTVQERLGHASAQETLDTYGHLWPDSEERTREAVRDLFTETSEASLRRPGTARQA